MKIFERFKYDGLEVIDFSSIFERNSEVWLGLVLSLGNIMAV